MDRPIRCHPRLGADLILTNAIQLLAVEDNDADAALISHAVSRCTTKFEIRRARSIREAIEAIDDDLPDIIALDINLPDAEGTSGVGRICAAAPAVPVVALTGVQDESFALEIIASGAQDYLEKHRVSPTEVERTFSYALKRAETDRALHAARAAADEAVRLKLGFVEAVSHEIRTPLHAILGMAETLSGTPLNEDQQSYLEVLKRGAGGLRDLLNNVLEKSRIDAGEAQIQVAEFDFPDLLEETARLYAIEAHRKGLPITVDCHPDLSRTVTGDRSRLRQLVTNLLGNAVKFTAEGMIELRAYPEASGRLVLEIQDSGPGIPVSELAHIFDRFAQTKATTGTQGTGLGLWICSKIAEMLGGSITAENVPNGGALFRARLRMDSSNNSAEAKEASGLVGKRILLVEDNARERALYTEWLSARGACVQVSDSEASARETLRHNIDFDHLILDTRMPDSTGLTLVKELVSDSRWRGEILALLMMNHRPGDLKHLRTLGCRYLKKPFVPTSLIEILTSPLPSASTAPPQKWRSPRLTSWRKPMRVLLAEDSLDSQELVRAHLRDAGVELTCVRDGAEAVAARRREEFSFLLLDLNMPRMDGEEAAIEIRRWERGNGAHPIPITLLSANTDERIEGVVQRINGSGYLRKPFSRKELLAVLEQKKRASPVEEIDDAIADLLPTFLGRRREDVDTIRSALAKQDFATIRTLGHRMRGNGASYGLPTISQIGEQIEEAASSKDADRVRQTSDALDEFLLTVSPEYGV